MKTNTELVLLLQNDNLYSFLKELMFDNDFKIIGNFEIKKNHEKNSFSVEDITDRSSLLSGFAGIYEDHIHSFLFNEDLFIKTCLMELSKG